jgi:hypothetical protein
MAGGAAATDAAAMVKPSAVSIRFMVVTLELLPAPYNAAPS